MTELKQQYLGLVARLNFIIHTEPGSVCEELEKLEVLRGIESQLIILRYRMVLKLKEERELILERISTAPSNEAMLLIDMLDEIDQSIYKLSVKLYNAI